MIKKLSVFFILFFIVACAAPKRSITYQQLISQKGEFVNKYDADLDALASKSYARLSSEYAETENQSYDILVLSGGGVLGAFGAGFLKGWGNVKGDGFERPDFDSVSGISTGALIAPFAFVGTQESYEQVANIYRNPAKDAVVARSILSFITGNTALYNVSGLHKSIYNSITPSLIEAIRNKGADNNALIVGATNLDYGVMRVWDLSEIEPTADIEDVRRNIATKLIASSAIPSAFPPIEINNHLYVDGGASMQVVSGIDDRAWLYDDSPGNLHFVNPDKPLKIRIWIIVNNKLGMEPSLVNNSWSSIATRSLVSLMRGSTLQTIQDIETFSQMINKREDFDVKLNYVSIPQDYPLNQTSQIFDSEVMRDLVELGEKMGANPNSWKQKALRPGAFIVGEQ